MGFRLTIEGTTPVNLDERSISNVEFNSEIPMDSNARATDHGTTLKVWGKMNFSLGAEVQDSGLNLAQWSIKTSDLPDCYQNVKVDVVAAGQIVRQYILPNAFVMEYTEELDDETGVGTFYLHVKQKKDITILTEVNGEFAV